MSGVHMLAQHMTGALDRPTPHVQPAVAAVARPKVQPRPRMKAPPRRGPGAIYNPLTPLSGNALKQAIQAEVNLQVKPQTDALDRQAADTKAAYAMTSGRAADYFNQFANAARGDVATTQGVANQNLAAQQGIDQNAAQALAQARAQAQGSLANDQTVRGSTAGYGADQLLGTLAQRQADLAQRSQADETAANSRGGAFEGYAAKMPGVAGLKGGETVSALGNAYQKNAGDISAKRASVAATAGPLFQQLLDKERDSQFNNAITMGGLNLKQADLQATTQSNNAKLALARSGQNKSFQLGQQRIGATRRGQDIGAATTRRGQDLTHQDRITALAQRRAAAAAAGGVAKPLTQVQQNAFYNQIGRAQQLLATLPRGSAQQIINQGYYTVNGKDSFGMPTQRRVNLPKVDAIAWQAAQDLQGNGVLQPDTVRALHARGIVIGSRYPTASSRGKGSPQSLRGLPH